MSSIDKQGVVRAAVSSRPRLRKGSTKLRGRFGCEAFASRMKMPLASNRGSRTPALRPTGNDVSGRRNRGSRTLDTADLGCLLYLLSYIAGGGEGSRSCGTHSSRAAARQCGSEPQPLTRNAGLDLGTDERRRVASWALIRILGKKQGKRTDFRLLFHGDAYAAKCIREFFGTPWSKNSIWSARILRLRRMKASYRFGTYGT